LYRFLDFTGLDVSLRNLPTGEEHEDTIRHLTNNACHCPWDHVEDAMEAPLQTIEADPDLEVCPCRYVLIILPLFLGRTLTFVRAS
jgi:hypothetical protein